MPPSVMVKSSLLYVLGRYGASAITVLAIAFYTRLATPADYGVYALVLSAAQTGYSTLLQWLRLALNRFLPSYAERKGFFLSQLAAGYLGVVLVITLLALALSTVIADPQIRLALILGTPLFAAMGLAELSLGLLQSEFKPGLYSLLSLFRSVTSALTGVLFLWLGYGAAGLVGGTILGYAACGLPVIWAHRSAFSVKDFDWQTIMRFARYGVVFALAAAMGSVIALADRYIIANMLGTEAAGLYSAPYDLANRSLQVLMLAISLAGTPLIFKAFEDGGLDHARDILRRQLHMLIGAGLPIALCLMILSPAVSTLLLGARFQAWGMVLMPWVVLATLVQGIETFYLSFAFSLTQRPVGQLLVLSAAAAVNIVLNLLWIPPFGLLGAAAATLVSAVLSVVGSFVMGRRYLVLPLPLRDMGKITLACVPLVLVLWPFRNETNPLIAFGLGVAAVAAYAVSVIALNVAGTRRLVRKSVPAAAE